MVTKWIKVRVAYLWHLWLCHKTHRRGEMAEAMSFNEFKRYY